MKLPRNFPFDQMLLPTAVRCLCTFILIGFAQSVFAEAPAEDTGKDIVIGMSAAFEGPSQALGRELYQGSMAYIEHVNATGGIAGRSIVINAYNDGYDPVSAVENTLRLIERDKVLLLFNYVGTPTVTRVLPLLRLYRDQHMYLFFPYTGAQPQREAPYDRFVFNLRASYRQELAGLVDHFVGIGRKKIAVFYQIDAYGRSGWDGVRRALEKYGLKIVGEATYRRGASYPQSFQEQAAILRATNPDAIISVGAYAAAAGFIRDVRDTGWDVPIANISFVGSTPMLRLLRAASQARGKDYTVNLINSQVVPSYEDTSLPAVRQYRQFMDQYQPLPPPQFRSKQDQSSHYSFISFEGFLNAKLLVEILHRLEKLTGKGDVKEVVEALHEYDLGIHAPVSFGPIKHQGLDTVYYVTVQEGRFVPITDWQHWAK